MAATTIADLADLHKADNDNRVVLLQTPLMVRGNCKMDAPGADAGTVTDVVYARDLNGTAVKLVSRRNSSSEEAFPSSLGFTSPTTSDIWLVPENTIVDEYHYNGGKNPEIIVRDLTADGKDYYDYLGKDQAVVVKSNAPYNDITISVARQFAIDEDLSDITLSPEMFGKIVMLRGLANWTGTDNEKTFELSEAPDAKTVKFRTGVLSKGDSDKEWEPSFNALSSGKTYSAVAVVEYDHTSGEYYLAPQKFYENFGMPTPTIADSEKHKFVTSDDGKEIVYTEECTSGEISLKLNITWPEVIEAKDYAYLRLTDKDGKIILKEGATGDYYQSLGNKTNDNAIDIATSLLTFDEESGEAVIYAYTFYKFFQQKQYRELRQQAQDSNPRRSAEWPRSRVDQ